MLLALPPTLKMLIKLLFTDTIWFDIVLSIIQLVSLSVQICCGTGTSVFVSHMLVKFVS